MIGSFSLRWPRLRFHYFPEKLARFRIRLTSFSFFLRSQVNKYGHFCLIGSFSLRCVSTSFSRFARRISTISHSPNLCFPSFEVKIFQLTSKGGGFHISHDASLHTILPSFRTHVILSVLMSSTGTRQLNNGGKRLVLPLKPSVPLLCRSIYDFRSTIPNISLVKSKRMFGRRSVVNYCN